MRLPSKSSIAIMYKLIVNATTKGQDLSTEDSSKFRKVRLSNEKIKAAITQVNGGLDIMQAVGFQLAEDNGETYLVYPPGESGPDWLPESLEAMQTVWWYHILSSSKMMVANEARGRLLCAGDGNDQSLVVTQTKQNNVHTTNVL